MGSIYKRIFVKVEFILTLIVTGPVARFARQIAGQGYICAAPSSYHEFAGPEGFKYDAEDTDRGNKFKISKVWNTRTAQPYTCIVHIN